MPLLDPKRQTRPSQEEQSAMKTVSVKVQNDYLERMCRVQQPLVAIEELIWN
jgi:hypothetical protein